MALKLKSGNLGSRDWWKILKSFISPTSSSGSTLPPIFDSTNDRFAVDDYEKANVLNSFFCSQSEIDDSSITLPRDHPQFFGENINDITITPQEVFDVLQTLCISKASGPDGINNKILVESAFQISSPLCRLYNLCLDKCVLPSAWKTSLVCPIFKSGDRSIPSNYRPVSLLNTMEKVLERILYKHIFNHLKRNNFFTPCQSGYLPGDSTVNQLTYLYNRICSALDSGREIRMVIFDITEAFDKVWHNGLIFKLHAAGIDGKVLSFLRDCLSNRTQKVVLPGGSSKSLPVRAEVPQGSVLGPLMFLLYINDIVDNLESVINLLADDTILSIEIDTPDISGAILQSDIEKINNWADRWLVKFNPSKSKSLLINIS